MTWLERLHDRYIVERRARILADRIAQWVPESKSVLDVGCGDGLLTARLAELRPDLEIRGVDVMLRPNARVPVTQFDGQRLPEADGAVDIVLLVDVIHHSEMPRALLADAQRAARQCLIIKDHRRDGPLAATTLGFMDRIGNARHGVALPQNYWSESEWRQHWTELGLNVDRFRSDLNLYPPPFGLVFDRGLHFLARLEVD